MYAEIGHLRSIIAEEITKRFTSFTNCYWSIGLLSALVVCLQCRFCSLIMIGTDISPRPTKTHSSRNFAFGKHKERSLQKTSKIVLRQAITL